MNIRDLYKKANQLFGCVEPCLRSDKTICAFNIVSKHKTKYQISKNRATFDVLLSYSVTGWHNCATILQAVDSNTVLLFYKVISDQTV